MVEGPAELDIAALVTEHLATVYRYAYRLSGSVADAEDLSQQVFLTAHEKLGQLRDVDSARQWLLAILRNCFLKSCQKKQPLAAVDLAIDVESIPERSVAAGHIDEECLQEALGELPPPHRLVLLMFYYEDLSYREIAERLDVPIGTVMSRLARAKAYLRNRLQAVEAKTPVRA